MLPCSDYRWRWVACDGVDPWLSLIIVLLLGAVLDYRVAVFVPRR
jgi:hypothetical protein